MWAMPMLYGLDKKGKTLEAVEIADWRIDDIKEYLAARLM